MTLPDLERFDKWTIEGWLVRARMRLHFALTPKGDRQARKIFCLGPAKTGTTSLHGLFEGNGLRSLHSAGNWRSAGYDAFSDRGDYRDFAAIDAVYPNARFILNTRGLRRYLSSYASHLHRKGHAPFSEQYFINRILRHNRRMAQVLAHFAGRDKLIVVNIERPGAMDFVADWLGLHHVDEPPRNVSKTVPRPEDEANIDAVLARLGLSGKAQEPFIIPELLPEGLRAAAVMPPAERVFL